MFAALRHVSPVVLALAGWFLVGPQASAENPSQREGAAPRTAARGPGVSIETVSWLSGHWQGEGLGGTCEVLWSGPAAGSMMGMFRFTESERTIFYELLTLVEEEGGLAIKLKHFHPDLTGWEAKEQSVSFPYIRCSADELLFDGLAHRRIGRDSLKVSVRLGSADGTTRERTVCYRRVKETADGSQAVAKPGHTIGSAAWIAGQWTCSQLGGVCEEFWSGPAHGAMMGMFRLIKDNQIGFYEFMSIAEESGAPVLRIKHFNSDLTGWEEQNQALTFAHVRTQTDELAFEGLIFRREGGDALEVSVTLPNQDGSPEVHRFPYRRID